MKHTYLMSLFAATIFLLTSCGNLDFKKTKSGLLYKIISTSDSKGPVAKPGNVLKLYFQRKLNDSVLDNNYGKMPAYAPIQAASSPNEYSVTEVLPMVKNGDSAIVVILIDSLLRKGMMPNLPPFMKKGDRLTISFKVVDLFTSDSVAQKDNMKEMAIDQERQQKEMGVEKEKEQKFIQDYLSSNKLNAQKTPLGSYVVVTDPGTGASADSGKVVSAMYRGTTFAGKIFDSNMDSSFHHTDPMIFTVGTSTIIPGLEDGIRLLKKGGKAKIYVPAVLGYGASPVMAGGKPYENLIFEIEVLDIKDQPVAQTQPQSKIDATQRKK